MAEPVLHSWPAGVSMHRIHPKQYGSTEFNASGLGDARFSPLTKPDDTIIPTLYGAETLRAAAMETVFHDLSNDPDNFILQFSTLRKLSYSVITPTRDLQLLDLGTIGLRNLKLRKANVIDTPATQYPHTRALAQTWHERFDDIDGLHWISRQDDHASACILFGDRIGPDDLAIQEVTKPLLDMPQLQVIVTLTKILRVNKVRGFPSSFVGF